LSKPNPFVNRITGYGTKAADQFAANPLNYRTHPQKQRDAVQASLRELGWIGVVIENTTTGNLIDGHERVWQALKNNEDVPYIQVELSEAEEKLALATFDPITYMAETDSAILDELLRDVNTGEAALQALLESLAIDAGLVPPDDPNEHWQGMPEYEQENVDDNKITVYFADDGGRVKLSGILGQTISSETKFIWFPEDARPFLQDVEKMRIESES
jgi:hypothetical protein